MNERIKLLAEQAGFNLHNDPIDGHDNTHEIKKFAELIVWECAEVFWSEACNMSDLAYEEYYRNSMKVKRHFGVEL